MRSNRLLASLFAVLACIGLGEVPNAGATVVIVPATGDLYLSGQPAGAGCCNRDTSPAESPILAPLPLTGSSYLTFAATGGAINQPGVPYATPDGNIGALYDLHADYQTGISGPTQVHLAGLAGVFLGASVPSGTAPAQLSGTDFTTISPGLGQIFFIGDGLTGTGSGAVQTFYIPTGATRLFLGIIDDGGYYDNVGSIVATITTHAPAITTTVPEPSEGPMVLLGLGGIAYATRRRGRAERQVSGIK